MYIRAFNRVPRWPRLGLARDGIAEFSFGPNPAPAMDKRLLVRANRLPVARLTNEQSGPMAIRGVGVWHGLSPPP